ncbi:MAG: hypothetical protein CVV02_04885 [Firmicutes bacterium HGW-Firmicutes-7]|nr:MAG: hypothetical protein CVV02_04885 [Firmicutes bacterium HGW-Firmicutes-7]
MVKKKEWFKKNTISIVAAASRLNIKTKALRFQIECGNIECKDNRIHESDFDIIQKQMSEYIGITEFIRQHDSDRFVARIVRNRNKYIDFLEVNEYFGAELHKTQEMLFVDHETDDFFITREDADYIDYKSIKFFKEFGYTEKVKIHRLIKQSGGHRLSMQYIDNYIKNLDDGNYKYTPSITNFVEIVFSAGDVTRLTDEDIISMIESADAVRTKELIVGFIKYVSRFEDVKYHTIDLEKRESKSVPAYSYEQYVCLAKILFNTEYDLKHDLTNKALENHNFAEMWLFLAIHYICGWRASDICSNWVYPNFKSNDNPFKIKIDTLREDIAKDKIEDEIYESVALYTIRKIEMSFNLPSKTPRDSAGKLRSEIVPELRAFFGKLILVAEIHHLESQDGYMKTNRISSYCNWTYCRDFFGEEIYKFAGRHNISSRRLNKSYLQGIEQATKDNGNTTLVAHMVASFARNHANVDTTAIYLKDHGLTGESAEVVLYMMMQRGVFGVSLYYMLVSAYPGAFEKLTAKDQTKLMEKIPLTAYEIETMGTVMVASERMISEFSQGGVEEPIEILKAMYAIGQGRGKSKDEGVFCKKKALGESCVHPKDKSCLANLCKYNVFTNDGIPSLVRVVKEYREKANRTGNKKYEVALNKKIIPAFQDIINTIIKEMSKREKESTKILVLEAFNE